MVGALYLCWRASERDARPYHLFYGSLFLGVGLGIRLSYAPWCCPGQVSSSTWPGGSPGMRSTVQRRVLWLAHRHLPVASSPVSPQRRSELLYDGLAFTSQHFTEWGGTFVSAAAVLEHQQLGYRLTMFFGVGLTAWEAGGLILLLRLVPSLVMLIAFGLRLAASALGKKAGFLPFMIPYGLWTFVGSMPTNPAISYRSFPYCSSCWLWD